MAYTPSNPNGQATSANSAPVVIASDQSNVPVTLGYGSMDTFGKLMTSHSHNDIDLQFFRDDPNNILTITTANGGAATAQSGYALFSTSTATAGSIRGVSTDKTHYHSGGEIYSMMAVAFISGGQATSFQRVGLYDTNDGFYIGYENTTFGVTVRNGASNTFTAQASFNVDTLTGTAESKFTRNGTPEAIDFTKLNVFRIRFGWLGAAPVKFEVLAPDGNWVLFHVIRQPNLSDTPHINNADLPMTLEATKTAGATNIQINTTCWGAGIQFDDMQWSETSTLGTAVNSVVEYNINGLGSASMYIATTTTGTMIFEVSIDGKVWFTHPSIIDPNIGGTDLLISAAFTPTSGTYYKVPLTGFKNLRARTVTTLGAPVAINFVGDVHDVFTDMAPAPHNIGYAFVHRDAEYTTAQTGAALWTPASGRRFVVTDITITTGGTTAGIVTLWQGASGDTTYTAGTDPAVFRGEFAPSNTTKPGVVKSFTPPFTATVVDHVLRVTTSAAMTVYIQVNGYEI